MRGSILKTGVALIALSGFAVGSCGRAHDRPHSERHFGEKPLKVVSRLDCPEKQGGLTRVSAAADGLSCLYTAAGIEVSLRLTPLNGAAPEAALAPIEAELKALTPAGPKPPSPSTPPAPPKPPSEDHVAINLPGLHIDADDGAAQVRVGRTVHVDAKDGGAEVRINQNVTGDGVSIHADDGGAEIRNGKRRVDNVHAMLILAHDKGAGAYPLVGYEARGPKGGPLVVAVVKSKDKKNDHDVFDDMKKLVRRNVEG